MTDEQEQTAIVPITEVLPELRDEQYAKVCEWDAARMALAGEYEAADGEYLKKIRDELKAAGHGLWTRYLQAREIPDRTARERIQKAEGRFVSSPRDKAAVPAALHSQNAIPLPEEQPAYEPVPAWPIINVHGADTVAAHAIAQQVTGRLAASPTYGAAWDDGDEWAIDARTPRGTPLSAYIPKVTPPASVPRDALPTTEQQWAHRITEIEGETPDIQALPLVRFISALHAINHITDEHIDAWLATAAPDELRDGADIFQRIERFAAHVQDKIKSHQRGGLRLVSD